MIELDPPESYAPPRHKFTVANVEAIRADFIVMTDFAVNDILLSPVSVAEITEE